MEVLLSLLMNPKVLMLLGAAGGFAYFYLKGRSDKQDSMEGDLAKAREALANAIKSAEKDNQDVEKKRSEDVQKANDADTADDLSRLLNEISRGQTERDPSDKK